MNHYRVWIKSVPGFYEQYSGSVEVWADNEEDAIDRAFWKLKRGTYPDRSREMWKIVKIERIPE